VKRGSVIGQIQLHIVCGGRRVAFVFVLSYCLTLKLFFCDIYATEVTTSVRWVAYIRKAAELTRVTSCLRWTNNYLY